MTFLRNIFRELLGLFVDDWAFALLLIAWVALFAVTGARIPYAPYVFLFGLAALTLVFVARKARSR